MRFVLFVEGPTEKDVLPGLLKRFLDSRLKSPVGIQPVNFNGWANLWRDVRQKADFYLRGPRRSSDIVAVISLLDLSGPTAYPPDCTTAVERLRWAKQKVEREVGDERFRQFFAVHELEAWLFSEPAIFPKEVRGDIQALSVQPEAVNFDRPPKRRLDVIYNHRLKRGYQPRVDGAKLFRLLSPVTTREKCPFFCEMLDDLLDLATAAQGSE